MANKPKGDLRKETICSISCLFCLGSEWAGAKLPEFNATDNFA